MSKISEIYNDKITFGAEIEFYLKEINIEDLKSNIEFKNINFIEERGNKQYEYHIDPTNNIDEFIFKIENSIIRITNFCESMGGYADFSPKPFSDDYGNALQIQFSSKSDKFQKSIDQICSSFCKYSQKTFLCYAPLVDDYKRYDSKFMAPTHISYGLNNRSCLIRINGDLQKRIEVRSPSPLCNYYVLISCIINQIIIANNDSYQSKLERIYGNAYDPQYNLQEIPKNIQESEELFDEHIFNLS